MKDVEKVNSEVEETIENVADEKKREFMKKFGKYAASTPVAGFALMTLGSSKAAASTIGCGHEWKHGGGHGWKHGGGHGWKHGSGHGWKWWE